MIEVITPIGRMSIFEIASDTSNNAAPNMKDPGMRYLILDQMNNLTTCGATNPTNPMVPV